MARVVKTWIVAGTYIFAYNDDWTSGQCDVRLGR